MVYGGLEDAKNDNNIQLQFSCLKNMRMLRLASTRRHSRLGRSSTKRLLAYSTNQACTVFVLWIAVYVKVRVGTLPANEWKTSHETLPNTLSSNYSDFAKGSRREVGADVAPFSRDNTFLVECTTGLSQTCSQTNERDDECLSRIRTMSSCIYGGTCSSVAAI